MTHAYLKVSPFPGLFRFLCKFVNGSLINSTHVKKKVTHSGGLSMINVSSNDEI